MSTSSLSLLMSGGAMGHDPFDRSSWSGSAANLASALQRREALGPSGGVQASPLQFLLLALANFSRDREVWRRKVFRSNAYRNHLTEQIGRENIEWAKTIIQIGAYCDGPAKLPNHRVLTYQDGCAATYHRSPFVPPSLMKDTGLAADVEAFERRVAQGANRVLVTSAWLGREMCKHYGLPPEKIAVVGCGMDPLLSAPNLDRDYGAKELLFIGKEFERKGGPELLEAFAHVRETHPDARLHIVGPEAGPPEDGVVWHGFLSRSDSAQAQRLKGLFERCTLFVLPSRYEPFGMAPLEAMAAGIPAIVTGKWALAENVRPGIDGEHVPANAPDALAATILQLIDAPERLSAMGKEASTWAKQFAWDRVAENIISAARSSS